MVWKEERQGLLRVQERIVSSYAMYLHFIRSAYSLVRPSGLIFLDTMFRPRLFLRNKPNERLELSTQMWKYKFENARSHNCTTILHTDYAHIALNFAPNSSVTVFTTS